VGLKNRDFQKRLILLVADAVVVEPVSTPQFPANRKKNRDLFNSGAISGSDAPVSPMFSGHRAKFPTQQSREFPGGEQGISGNDQGNSRRAPRGIALLILRRSGTRSPCEAASRAIPPQPRGSLT
jgi:hypothetical protein